MGERHAPGGCGRRTPSARLPPMAREFTKVGVIGLGTMGAGIVEVFARNGIDVVAVEVTDEAVEKGRGVLQHSTDRAVSRGKLTRRGPGRAPRAGPVHERHGRPQGVPARRRGRARAPRPQEGHLRQARRDRLRRRDPRDQHELAARHRDRRRDDQPQARRRHALLQPRAGAPVRRGHQDRHHERRDLRGRQGARRAARQEARHRRRQGRLHRQRPALRLPQPRRRDVREQVRDARGHRRRDEARLRLPDGPARADGPHRARHGLRDPRHDVQAGTRPPARAEPDHQADGQRRA